jgi:formylglycine-generating enzyme required for sulfatase activity
MLAGGCSTDRCKKGTVFLSYTLTGGAESAATIDVTLAIGNGAAQTKSVSRKSGDKSIEVDLAAYPSGQSLTFTLTARAGGTVLASASKMVTAMPGCTTLSFELEGGASDLGFADGSTHDLAGPDMAMATAPDMAMATGPDMAMATAPDMVFVPPSCTGLAANCGASLNDNCCTSPVVPGGTYYRSYDVAGDVNSGDTTNPATVSDFRLDKYEVTVGRFRKFVNAGKGTQTSPPSAGSGANPYIANSGWDSSWNANLLADTSTLTSASGIQCDATYQTWTASAGANEDRPINCVDWYEAFAFCAWDGGFLPTEAEWNYAASGGSEQRAYRWSNPPSSLTIDCSYANYFINNPAGVYCGPGGAKSTNNVGTESPKGDGKWGQSDLAGNVWEWNLDWDNSYPLPCKDCANLTAASSRVIRGGGFSDTLSVLRPAYRDGDVPTNHDNFVGFRCARRAP